MRVDVVDLFGLDAGVAQGVAHDAIGAVAVLGRRGDVKGVAAHAVAHDLGDDRARRAALARSSSSRISMPAPSPTTKPSRCLSHGRLAFSGSSLRVESARMAAKPPMPMAQIGSLGAAADHHVGVAALDDLERIADGVGAGGAGGGGGRVRPLGAGADRDVTGGQIDDGRRNEEGRDPARPALQQIAVFALDDLESADAAADVDAHPFGVFGRHRQSGHAPWRNPTPRRRTG